ncbi:type II toxin-antitoxin system VapC family toxin (plasmid) [Rhizobium sullae]|uniref:Type II toxin-antitoxin system VapC family toxin n=1 Tax=Rhizobium sullae TaxID=50338 RepID=A0ABY5XUX9_RHISU|nr:type II toxin-antitoxin system VapC family toxin [Rhizobium sullae]UWU18434.1 type II toxin-antitoxin system VapC family toxin [Rhizobium sullae]
MDHHRIFLCNEFENQKFDADPRRPNQALKVFKEFRESIFECLEVPRGCFIEAARLSDRHDTSLRSGDALHMAVAHHYGLTLLTRDKGLAKAAAVIGAQHQLI